MSSSEVAMADASTPSDSTSEFPGCSHGTSDQIATPGISTPPTEQLEPKEDFVCIPDMFTSIMSAEACVNPSYRKVKSMTDTWIAKY